MQHQVTTGSGRLDGVGRAGHVAFLGIPYAAPPVGALRWRAPQPPAAWAGVRDAQAPGAAAPQSTHAIPGFAASGPQDEDCLFLNVFTPAVDAARRPVLVWIHGGGFTHGTGADALYDGGRLAVRGDAVVVTINYRLGALGFLALDARVPGTCANAGLLDCIAALRWVQGSIAAFGGDPGNVTLFGESAGSMAVATLLAMPAARGLFRRAVLQSGGASVVDRARADGVVDALCGALGVDPARPEALLDCPATAIVAAQATLASTLGALPFGPVVDGDSLPMATLDAVRAGHAAGVQVLAGTNRDEVKLFAPAQRAPLAAEDLQRRVARLLPAAAPDAVAGLIATYARSRTAHGLPATPLDLLDAIQSDVTFRIPALRLARAQQAHQPDVWTYLFTYASPARRGALGACHALELPFVFGTLDAPTQDRFAGTGPDVERLSATMMDAWLAFARSGDPATAGTGAWPAFTAARHATMLFDRRCGAVDDPFADERRALEACMPAG